MTDSSTSPQPEPSSSFLDSVPKLIVGVSFTVLALSVVHEWAYFSVVGSKFMTFVSATDYVLSAINWLPLTAILACTGILLSQTMTRLELQLTGREASTFYGLPTLLLIALLMVSAIFNFFFLPVSEDAGFQITVYVSLVFLLWPAFAGWLLIHQGKRRVSRGAGIFVITGPPVLAMAFGLGLQDAYADLKGGREVYSVVLNNAETEQNVVLLRTMENGLLFRDTRGNRLFFKRWDSITSIERTVFGPEIRSRSCLMFGWKCLLAVEP